MLQGKDGDLRPSQSPGNDVVQPATTTQCGQEPKVLCVAGVHTVGGWDGRVHSVPSW